MQERACMRWSSYTISSDTLLENHTYFKYIHTCLTLSTTYHSLLHTGADVPPLLNLKLANSMSASNHLPTDVRSCLVACAVDDSTQVVKQVALFVCLGDKHVQIASSFLPIQTRWGQSSRPEAGFASLLDPDGSAKRTGWLSGEVLSIFFHIMAASLGWGTVNKPPDAGQNVWVADPFMYTKWQDAGGFVPTPNLDCGVSGQFVELQKFSKVPAVSFAGMCQASLQSQVAFIPIHLNLSHWVYVIVNFEEQYILLHDSYGDPNSTILQRVSQWAHHIQKCRNLTPVEFKRRIVTTTTQFDGHQCGVHVGGNILSAGNYLSGRVNKNTAQHVRLWISIIIWLGGDMKIEMLKSEWAPLSSLLSCTVCTTPCASGDDKICCTPMPFSPGTLKPIFEMLQQMLQNHGTLVNDKLHGQYLALPACIDSGKQTKINFNASTPILASSSSGGVAMMSCVSSTSNSTPHSGVSQQTTVPTQPLPKRSGISSEFPKPGPTKRTFSLMSDYLTTTHTSEPTSAPKQPKLSGKCGRKGGIGRAHV